MEKEDIEKIKMYLKEYQDKLYSMHDTAIWGIRLHKERDWNKEPHAKETYEMSEKLKVQCENKIEDIDDLISRI